MNSINLCLLLSFLFVCTMAVTTTTPNGGYGKQDCNGTWSEWKNATDCTDECGGCGYQNQTRTCETADCQCQGESTRLIRCAISVCLLPRHSCCDGLKREVFIDQKTFKCLHPDDSQKTSDSDMELASGGKWGDWKNTYCKDGNMKQYRDCVPIDKYCSGNRTQTVPCKNKKD